MSGNNESKHRKRTARIRREFRRLAHEFERTPAGVADFVEYAAMVYRDNRPDGRIVRIVLRLKPRPKRSRAKKP